jgi:calcineurin-like phosphoesterase family protein
MSETFVVADTHIGHYNVVLHGNREQFIYPNPNYDPEKPDHFKTNNPRAVHLAQHDEFQIDTWNGRVSKKDDIWILGDLAWKHHASIIPRLNGKKYLIRGNHDKMSQDAYRMFQQIEGAHYRYSYPAKIHKKPVMLAHCPYDTWFSSPHGSWHLYGHCHGRREEFPWKLCFDCGVDVWGGPVPWNIIEAKMADKEVVRKEYIEELNKNPKDADRFILPTRELNTRYMNGETDILRQDDHYSL